MHTIYDLLENEPYPDPHALPLIDPNDLAAAITAITGVEGDDYNEPSSEEGKRLALLCRLRDAPDRLMRSPLFGDTAMLARVGDLKATCPNFIAIIEMVERAVRASMIAKAPLVVRPFVALGEPGVGKTHFVRRLADAIGTTSTFVPANTIATIEAILGAAPVWRGAKIGAVGAALLAGKTLSPIVVLDEIEKVRVGTIDPRPLDGLLSLFEEETADKLEEGYLGTPIRASSVIYCLTANSLEPLEGGPLLDRLLIFEVGRPDRNGQERVLRAVFDRMNERLNGALDDPDVDVIDALRAFNTRRAKVTLELAAGFTLADGRSEMTVADVEAAMEIVNGNPRARRPMGFGITRGFTPALE